MNKFVYLRTSDKRFTPLEVSSQLIKYHRKEAGLAETVQHLILMQPCFTFFCSSWIFCSQFLSSCDICLWK